MEPDRPLHTPGKDAREGALKLFLAQSVNKSALDLERLWNLTGPLILQVKMLICVRARCSSTWAVSDQERDQPGALMEPDQPPHTPGKDAHLYGALQLYWRSQ